MRREQRPNQNSFKLNSNLLPIKEKKNPNTKKSQSKREKNQHIPIESTKGLETLDLHSNQLPSNPLKLKPVEILLKKKKTYWNSNQLQKLWEITHWNLKKIRENHSGNDWMEWLNGDQMNVGTKNHGQKAFFPKDPCWKSISFSRSSPKIHSQNHKIKENPEISNTQKPRKPKTQKKPSLFQTINNKFN